jgi:serine/threonine protein phosphatase PrpC
MVADGHGHHGHHVSRFIANTVPILLKNLLQQSFYEEHGIGHEGGDPSTDQLTLGKSDSENSKTSFKLTNAGAMIGDRWEFTKKRQALIRKCLNTCFDEIHQ